jgi:hypothetical protein
VYELINLAQTAATSDPDGIAVDPSLVGSASIWSALPHDRSMNLWRLLRLLPIRQVGYLKRSFVSVVLGACCLTRGLLMYSCTGGKIRMMRMYPLELQLSAVGRFLVKNTKPRGRYVR